MPAFERLLDLIQRRKVKEAVEGLRTPKSKDAYELGRLAGVQEGLGIAESLWNQIQNEEKEDEPNPKSKR